MGTLRRARVRNTPEARPSGLCHFFRQAMGSTAAAPVHAESALLAPSIGWTLIFFGEVTPAYHFCEARSAFASLSCGLLSSAVRLRVAFFPSCTAAGLCRPPQGVGRSWSQRNPRPELLPCPDIQARSM